MRVDYLRRYCQENHGPSFLVVAGQKLLVTIDGRELDSGPFVFRPTVNAGGGRGMFDVDAIVAIYPVASLREQADRAVAEVRAL